MVVVVLGFCSTLLLLIPWMVAEEREGAYKIGFMGMHCDVHEEGRE